MLNKSVKYKKCPGCELNYIEIDEELCSVCKRGAEKDDDDLNDYLIDVCPFCEKNALPDGEDMCEACVKKHRKKEAEEV